MWNKEKIIFQAKTDQNLILVEVGEGVLAPSCKSWSGRVQRVDEVAAAADAARRDAFETGFVARTKFTHIKNVKTYYIWHWCTIGVPSFLADFEIIPIPNLPNLTDPRIPSPNRALRPLTPAPIPP